MYSVKGDGITIYNDMYVTESAKAINPKLNLKDNSAGSLEITLPIGNAGYDVLKRMSSEITVYRDNDEIWSGRIITEKNDFRNNRILTCEGELAYLNDTTQPQNKYEYDDESQAVRQFLIDILSIHNSKVDSDKQFTVGAVTVHEKIRVFTNDENTFSVINANLLGVFGGHLRIRKENGVRYLDYLQDWPNTNTQEIRFGQNLLDFTKNWDASNFATVVTPRGAKLEESTIPELEAYVDVSSVNGGSRYVTNEEGVSNFGWIEVVVTWDNIEDPSELLTKAKEYLTEQQFDNMVVEVTAVDLRYLGVTSDSITLLDEVRCVSRPHGLDRIFPVSELTIQLDKPENSTYTLGDTIQNESFTSTVKSANQSIIDKIDSKPTAQQILTNAKENATQLINLATNGYVTIQKNDKGTQSLDITSSINTYDPSTGYYSDQTKLWRWNINGLGYSKNGGRKYETAITMDGSIVANFITTGEMSANRIRTGLLTSTNGNSSWNLDTGVMTMTTGSIDLGNGMFSVNDDGYLKAEYGLIGGFTIDSGSIYNDVINLNSSGLDFYLAGSDYLGRYGTQYWEKKPSCKGLSVSMEHDTSYITWSYKDNASDDTYTIKLMYVSERLPMNNGGYFKANRIHFGCDIDGNNYTAYNWFIDPDSGGADGGLLLEGGSSVNIPIVNSSGEITGSFRCRIKGGFIIAA